MALITTGCYHKLYEVVFPCDSFKYTIVDFGGRFDSGNICQAFGLRVIIMQKKNVQDNAPLTFLLLNLGMCIVGAILRN